MSRLYDKPRVREPSAPPAPATTSSAAAHQLIWPSIPDDLSEREQDRFQVPAHHLVKARCEYLEPIPRRGRRPGADAAGQACRLGLAAFWVAAATCKTLLILDRFFGEAEVGHLHRALEANPVLIEDLRILTKEQSARNPFDAMERMLREDCGGALRAAIHVETQRDADDFPHDRFAVVDRELWHFGGTVGGLHKQMTAASRGWDAAETRFAAYFDQRWDDLARGRCRHPGGWR